MLILKGNFLKLKCGIASFGVLLTCALACSLACPFTCQAAADNATVAAPRAEARAPDVVAAEFYGWYLDTLSADQDPLSDRYPIFTRYVAKDLADKLVERLRAGRPLPDDYFIQSAGYRQDWLHRVQASVVRQRGNTAEVLVTLGKEGSAMRVLGLAMVLENGTWKIRHVTRVGGDAFKSSAEQPVI